QRTIDRSLGGGQPLDKWVAAQVGGQLKADLSNTRIHIDNVSDQINQSLGSEAATVGNDIFFSQGAYQPDTATGQKLLRHELAHVAQQGTGKANRVQTRLQVGPANDVYEREADRVADSVLVSAAVSKAPLTVQRKLKFKPEKLAGKKSFAAAGKGLMG